MKLARTVALGAIIIGGAGVLCYGFLWDHYYDALPRSAQPSEGRIYAMNLRGRVVYGTRSERNELRTIKRVSAILALLGLAGYILTDASNRRMGGRHCVKQLAVSEGSARDSPGTAKEQCQSKRGWRIHWF